MELTKKKKQSEQSVRHIISITLQLLAQKGYGNTSIADISEASGLTKGALYHHFSNKEDLFEHCMSHLADIFRQKLLSKKMVENSSIEMLRSLIENIIEICEENYHYLLIISSMTVEIESRKHSFAQPLIELLTELSRFIERFLEKGQTSGEISSDFDVKLLSLNILGLLFGTTIPWLLNKNKTNYRVIMQSQKEILVKSIKN